MCVLVGIFKERGEFRSVRMNTSVDSLIISPDRSLIEARIRDSSFGTVALRLRRLLNPAGDAK